MANTRDNHTNRRGPSRKTSSAGYSGRGERGEQGSIVGFKDGQPIYRKEPRGQKGQSRSGAYGDAKERGAYGEGAPRRTSRETGSQDRGAYRERPARRSRSGRDDAVEYPFKTREEQVSTPRGARQQGRQQDAHAYGAREDTVQPDTYEDELPYFVMGRNAVREALRSGRSIDRILVTKEQDGSLREILSLARDNNVQIREVTRAKLDELCMPFGHGGKPGNHQGIVAMVPAVEYCDISDILDVAAQRGEPPFVILLDGIEDPHNLGSIIRSAECAGAHGVIIPKRRSASVTAAASKASAGAVEYMKVARVSNLSGAIARLKDAGLWIAGADMQGQPMTKANLKGPLGLVIGSESSGISKLVRENCDFLVSIPMKGRIDSLNASVAAAVLMFEKGRQDAE